MVAQSSEDDELEEFLEWLEFLADDTQDGFKNTERKFRKWHTSTQ